ncbi:MAG: hypothetical protein WC121_09480 [Candidatus Kapaibacterium sp.]
MFNKKEEATEKIEFESLSLDFQNRLNSHQNFSYAVVGGLFLSLLCAVMWAAITVAAEMQIGYMAIGVGMIVGHGVKFFGAGFETRYGVLGASLAFLGCFLGNFFSQIGFLVNENGMTYLEVFTYLDWSLVNTIMKESFSGMDVFFYAFAIYVGYRMSFRPIPENYKESLDLSPLHDRMRLPSVGITFFVLVILAYYISSSVNGEIVHYDLNGNIEYTGKIENGLETGKWEYFNIDGSLRYYGEYKNGKEEGIWIQNYENGKLNTISNFRNGLFTSSLVSYYESGTIYDSSIYVMGRLHGSYISYYESGNLMTTGNYTRDLQTGEWKSYYENGTISFVGNFEDGELNGVGSYYDSLGTLVESYSYKEGEVSFIYQQDSKGKRNIVNGNGLYKTYYENGQLKQVGKVKSGERVDEWKIYHSNGEIFELASIVDNKYIIKEAFYRNGNPMIVNGNGDYLVFYDTTDNIIEKGTYKNGLKHGLWKSFYAENGQVQHEFNLNEGVEDGAYYNYSDSGVIITEGTFVKGKKSGSWIWYYENGAMSSIVEYKEGKKVGKQIFYSELGYEAKEEVYKDGELVSEKYLE